MRVRGGGEDEGRGVRMKGRGAASMLGVVIFDWESQEVKVNKLINRKGRDKLNTLHPPHTHIHI